jgi:membrane-bound serine protease (ClpP class)
MLLRMELVIALLVVGCLLVLAETILPGMIAGILGVLCIMGGVVAGYAKFGTPTGHYILLGVTAVMVAGAAVWIKVFPNTRLARVFISEKSVGNLDVEKPSLLGQPGTALSQLRPSGVALINGQRVDVITEGSLVEKGTPIKVIALEGLRVVVRPQAPSPASSPSEPQPST